MTYLLIIYVVTYMCVYVYIFLFPFQCGDGTQALANVRLASSLTAHILDVYSDFGHDSLWFFSVRKFKSYLKRLERKPLL